VHASVVVGFASVTHAPALLGRGESRYVEYLFHCEVQLMNRDEHRFTLGGVEVMEGHICRFRDGSTNGKSWRWLMLVDAGLMLV